MDLARVFKEEEKEMDEVTTYKRSRATTLVSALSALALLLASLTMLPSASQGATHSAAQAASSQSGSQPTSPDDTHFGDDTVMPSEAEKKAVQSWRKPSTRAETPGQSTTLTYDVVIVALTTPKGTPHENTTQKAKDYVDNINTWYQRTTFGKIAMRFKELRTANVSTLQCTVNPSNQPIPTPSSGASGVFVTTINVGHSECPYGGIGTLGGVFNHINVTYATTPAIPGVAIHEIGHNLGLHHQNTVVCPEPTKLSPTTGGTIDCDSRKVEYGDRFGLKTLNAVHLDMLHALPNNSVVDTSPGNNYTLSPLHGTNPTNPRLLYVGTANHLYAIEYRRSGGNDEENVGGFSWTGESGIRILEVTNSSETLAWDANYQCTGSQPTNSTCTRSGPMTYGAGSEIKLPGGKSIKVNSTNATSASVSVLPATGAPSTPDAPTITKAGHDYGSWSYKAQVAWDAPAEATSILQSFGPTYAGNGPGAWLRSKRAPGSHPYFGIRIGSGEQSTSTSGLFSTTVGAKLRVKNVFTVDGKAVESEWSPTVVVPDRNDFAPPPGEDDDWDDPWESYVYFTASRPKTTSRNVSGNCTAGCIITINQSRQKQIRVVANSKNRWSATLHAYPRKGETVRFHFNDVKIGWSGSEYSEPALQPRVAGKLNKPKRNARSVSGTCSANCTVTVKVGKRKYTAKAPKSGRWKVRTPKLKRKVRVHVTFTKSRHGKRTLAVRVR